MIALPVIAIPETHMKLWIDDIVELVLSEKNPSISGNWVWNRFDFLPTGRQSSKIILEPICHPQLSIRSKTEFPKVCETMEMLILK
jgi:hypothetical protein